MYNKLKTHHSAQNLKYTIIITISEHSQIGSQCSSLNNRHFVKPVKIIPLEHT